MQSALVVQVLLVKNYRIDVSKVPDSYAKS